MTARKPNKGQGRCKTHHFVLLVLVSLLLFLNTFYGLVWTNQLAIMQRYSSLLPISSSLDPVEILLGNFTIHVGWHPKYRQERFPSVQERVKLYMTNWYLPSCRDDKGAVDRFKEAYQKQIQNESWPRLSMSDPSTTSSRSSNTTTMMIDSLIHPDHVILLHPPTVQDCARSQGQYNREGKLVTETRIQKRWNLNTYCSEVVELLQHMSRLDTTTTDGETPILAFFGDEVAVIEEESWQVPMFAKHRAGTTPAYIHAVTEAPESSLCWKESRPPLVTAHHQDEYGGRLSPILWKLELVRHWNTLPGALRKDIPWEEKRNQAFFAGDLTGEWEGDTDLERCWSNQRCRFVMEHDDSDLIEARISHHLGVLTNSTVNGTRIVREKVGVDIVQQYKVIISFEGNDVASGLKWMLQSQSVVLMPPPTRTSWAMEELLERWVHYIPMFPNGSNANAMVQWVLDHDGEARRIAERATLFLYDLVYHPEAARDDRMIRDEMTKRYRSLWH